MSYRKKTIQICVSGIIFFNLFLSDLNASNPKTNQINVSFTLSGHILLGIGFSHFFDDNNAVQTTFFIIPEKGFPFAISGGYNYFFGEKKWRPNIGAEFLLLASPPDSEKRKFLPLINFVPGIRYDFDKQQNLNSRLWIAYFLKSTRVKIAPIGIEFKYGNNF